MAVIANLVVRVRGDLSDFNKAIEGLERPLGKFGDKMTRIGGDLTKGITVPLGLLGGASIKAAMDFESSFAGVRKTVDGVVDAGGNLTGFGKQLQGEFRALAKEIPISVNELNRIGEMAGQLGIRSESIIGFTKTIAAMSVATNLSAEQAADGMARFANITQMPQENISNLGSTIVELGNKLAATESEILEFGLRIAGAGEIAGLAESQILGIGAAFASVGIEAEAGGTAVQKALLAMNSAVTTGKFAEEFGAIAGMSGSQFRRGFATDPGDTFLKFVEGIGAAGKGGEALLRGVGIDDARQIRAFLSLAAAGDTLRNSLKLAADEWVRNTALTREAEQRYKTFESQLILFKNTLYDIAITAGTSLIESFQKMTPAIETALNGLAGAVNWFAQLPESVQTATFAFGAFATALGPIAWTIGNITNAVSGLIGMWKLIPTALQLFLLGGGVAAAAAVGIAGVAAAEAAHSKRLANAKEEDLMIAPDGGIYTRGELGLSGSFQPRVGAPSMFQAGATGMTSLDEAIALSKTSGPLGQAANAAAKAIASIGAAARGSAAGVGELKKGLEVLTNDLRINVVQATMGMTAGMQWMANETRRSTNELRGLTMEGLIPVNEELANLVESTITYAPAVQGMSAATMQFNEELDGTTQRVSLVGAFAEDMRHQFSYSLTEMLTGAQSFKNGFLGIWEGIKAGLRNIFQGILDQIIGGFVQGGLNRIGGMFGGLLGGGGAGAGASGGVGGVGGAAFMSNPWTLAALGGIALGTSIWKGGLFRGGEEALQVNPARDAYLARFGGAGHGEGSGFNNLAAKLTEITGEEGGGRLFELLRTADSMQEFNLAVESIEAKLQENADKVKETAAASDSVAQWLERIAGTLEQILVQLGGAVAAAVSVPAASMMTPDDLASASEGSTSGVWNPFVHYDPDTGEVTTSTAGDRLAAIEGSAGLTVQINAGTIVGNPDELAQMVTEAWEGGGEEYERFRILSAQAVGA